MNTLYSKWFASRQILAVHFSLLFITAAHAQIPMDGLQLWLNPDVGVTLNGSTVSQWADQSGNGNNVVQITTSRQPLFVNSFLNGHPIIRFDGINDKLGFTGSTQLSQVTLFMVVKNEVGSNNNVLVFGEPNNFNLGYQLFIVFRGLDNLSDRIGIGFSPDSGIRAFGNGIGNFGEWRVITLVIDQTIHNSTLHWNVGFANMVPIGTDALLHASLGDPTGSGGGLGGADGVPVGTLTAKCDFAEVIVYNIVPTEEERGNIEHYLSEKYNIQVDPFTPVELASFNSTVNGNSIQLSWQTASEINNQGFEIYRNGNKISFVEGKGTTTDNQYYTFLDEYLKEGIYNYRLNQLDFDGTHRIVGELTAYLSLPEQFTLEQNYPNPFNPSTTIKYSIPTSEFVILKVFDVLGNEVATLVNEENSAGSYEIDFNTAILSSGIYLYTLQTGSYSQTKKLILMK